MLWFQLNSTLLKPNLWSIYLLSLSDDEITFTINLHERLYLWSRTFQLSKMVFVPFHRVPHIVPFLPSNFFGLCELCIGTPKWPPCHHAMVLQKVVWIISLPPNFFDLHLSNLLIQKLLHAQVHRVWIMLPVWSCLMTHMNVCVHRGGMECSVT